MSHPSILVVGGGAAGMMTAVTAARAGAPVTVLERLDRVGKKLLSTGNGRCNLTNVHFEGKNFHGGCPGFAVDVVHRFPPAKTMEFFESLGLLCSVEEGGLVYPACGQASAVLDVLRFEMDRLGVKVHGDAEIQRVSPGRNGFEARVKDGRAFSGDRLVLAAGGKAAPNLGSNGSGFEIAKALGHRLVEPIPGLVQLNLSAPFLKHVDGVKFNGSAAVTVDGRVLREESGEILFTSYGISGIPILQLGRVAGEMLHNKKEVFLDLRFFPSMKTEDVSAMVADRLRRRPDRSAEEAMIGTVNKKLIGPLLRTAGIERAGEPCGRVTEEQVRRLSALLSRWRFPVTGTQGWLRAQVTSGGVDTAEIDPQRMESKIVPGLFLAGEIIDVDGDCGGYNLQWAWSSGRIAGLHAAAQ